MNGIQFVNTLTERQWESVYADNRLSETYRSNIPDQKKLEIEFANRVRTLCDQTHLPIPKKIVVTYGLNDALSMRNSGELQIHPLSFIACKLNRNEMNSKQNGIYERLESYIIETSSLIHQYKNSPNNEKSSYPDSPEYKKAAQELVERYRTELADNLQDYKYVVPAAELDDRIIWLLTMHKAHRYPTITPTITKIASASIAALNGFTAGWIISKFTSDSMSLPIAGSGAFLVAGASYVALKIAERIGRVVAMTLFDQDMKSLVLKPWDERTLESKINLSSLELLKCETFPKYPAINKVPS